MTAAHAQTPPTLQDATAAADDPRSTESVDVGDKASLKRWCDALKVTDEALQRAVQKVGPRIDRVKDYLTGGGAADQSGG